MKNIILSIIIAVAAMLTSCDKEENFVPEGSPGPTFIESYIPGDTADKVNMNIVSAVPTASSTSIIVTLISYDALSRSIEGGYISAS